VTIGMQEGRRVFSSLSLYIEALARSASLNLKCRGLQKQRNSPYIGSFPLKVSQKAIDNALPGMIFLIARSAAAQLRVG
jgi:hypothetical protein